MRTGYFALSEFQKRHFVLLLAWCLQLLHLSPDDCSLILGVDRAIRALFETFHQYFVPLIDQLNDAIVVGGCGADLELDEISFFPFVLLLGNMELSG